MNSNQRDRNIDILKGFGIFLMVCGHVGWGQVFRHYIDAFHMPLFFFASGYLWRDKGDLTLRIKEKGKKLLIPYFFYGIIFAIIGSIEFLANPVNTQSISTWWKALFWTSTEAPLYNTPLWFLPAMFFADILYTFIRKYSSNILQSGILVTVIVCIGCLYSSQASFPTLPWSIEPALTGIGFMFIGELVHRSKGKNFDATKLPFSVSVVLLILTTITAFINPTVNMRLANYCIVPLFIFNGAAIPLVWLNLIRFAEDKCHFTVYKKASNTLCYFSRNSMYFLVFNRIFIYKYLDLAAYIGKHIGIVSKIFDHTFSLVLTLISCALCTNIITRLKEKYASKNAVNYHE